MPTKPRVTHVITGLATGGAEMMLLKLVQNSADPFDHTIISLGGLGTLGPLMQRAGATVVPLNLKPGRIPLNGVRHLLREVRRSDPDVVQGWMYHGNLAATLAQPFTKRAVALGWSIRCSFNDRGNDKWLTRSVVKAGARLSNRPATIIYNAARARAQHTANGYTDRNAVVIPNGFDTDRFRPDASQRRSTREKWGIGPDAIAIGLLARVHPMKDHATFLKAAAVVKQRNPNVVFVVAGKGAPGLRSKMADLVLPVEPNLHLLPEEADTPAFMNGLDIFALSSAWGEAFPNVLGEAMACAVPCIATDVGDAAEIVADTGRIVAVQSPEQLAQAMLDLAAAGPEARRALGERARGRIAANYTMDSVARRYGQVWLDLVNRAAVPARSAS